MKKFKIYILVLGAIVLSACSESFLDSKPLTTLTEANFYKTPADAEMALVGCYDGVQSLNQNGVAFPIASELMSDNTYGGTGNTDGYGYQVIDEFDISRSPSDVNMFNSNWADYYKAIYRCNVLLQKMDQIDWKGNNELRDEIEAQTRFLRAFCYFDMVRLWENIPLLTAPSSENVPQANPDEVYKLIADDLLFAAEKGSSVVSPGRVNKWAAKSFMARVYMFYTGYYGKADLVGKITKAQTLQGLEDVIATGNYELIPDFKNLWPAASTVVNADNNGLETSYAGKDNKETIFAIKHNITSNYNGNTDSNHWMVMLGLRSQSFSPYGKGWGGCTVNPKLYASFENNDQRKKASIIGIAEEKLNFNNSDQREYTGYTVKKYTPLSMPDGKDLAEFNGAVNFMIGQYQDFVSIRYADVLLMAAELGSTNAQSYFDSVRARAGLTSKPASQANIMVERKLEFAFEGIRYWDLLRQGLETAANTIAESTKVKNGGVETSKSILKENIIKTRGFQMIPQEQVSLSNGVLKQNAGWE